MHKVDIIIPTFNYGKYLESCLQSILAQSRNDYRVLIMDNASTDDTESIARRWVDKSPERIRYVRNDQNLGMSGNIQKGYTLTSAPFVLVLCADDEIAPDFLAKTVTPLESDSRIPFAFSGWTQLLENSDGKTREGATALAPFQCSGRHEVTDFLLAHGNFITLSFGVFRRTTCDAVGGAYPLTLDMLGDYYLWLRLATTGAPYYVHEPIGRMRIHGASETGRLVANLRSSIEHIRLPDLVFESDLWPMSSRLLAKARQVQWLTGESLAEVAQSMAKHGHALVRQLVEANHDEFFLAVARALLSADVVQDNISARRDAITLLKARLDAGSTNGQIAATYKQATRKGSPEEQARYRAWTNNHQLLEIDGQLFAERMLLQWQTRPVFQLLTWVEPTDLGLLADTLDSLQAQMYSQWRLAVVSPLPCPDPLFNELGVVSWIVSAPSHASDVFNTVMDRSDADWFAVVPPGIRLAPHCLLRLGDYINLHPEWAAIYTDEDVIDADGERHSPRFKPEFNLDLLRSTYYPGNLCAIRKMALGQYDAPLFRSPGADDYDLLLRTLDAAGEDAIGHIADVLVHVPDRPRQADERAEIAALADHLKRNRIAGEVLHGYLPNTYRIAYGHARTPRVSIIVPNKDKPEFLVPCIESLLDKTDYPNYEVIVVDNQSSDPDLFSYYNQLLAYRAERVRIIDYPHPFNYSAVCNQAAEQATGEYLLFLNNDTQILHPEWLSRMMAHAQRPDVGVVGARLVYPESGRIQHAGVIVGLDGVADHHFIGQLELTDPGYMNRALVEQNYSAVTGACQLIRKDLYRAVGGQDEVDLTVSYNDIDLCLKVVSRKLKVVWTPFATLVHHGSVTQKSDQVDLEKQAKKHARFKKERETMIDRWLPILARDPAYNPNLSLLHRDMRVEHQLPINWDVNFHDRKRVLGIPLPGGSGDFRIIQPFEALSQGGRTQCEYIRFAKGESRVPLIAELARLAPDTVVLHAALNDVEILFLEAAKKHLPHIHRVFMLDDLVTQVPEKSSAFKSVMRHFRDAKPRLREALRHCDRLVVSTPPLAELCRDLINDIAIVPNKLRRDVWTPLTSLRNQGTKPRVGWAGAQQHQGDLEWIEPVVRALGDEVEWIFMGMCPDSLKPWIKEFHDFVAIDQYPAKLAALNLDLAVAPLEVHPFNAAKSNLRLLEYGVLGWPVVCTDIDPYQFMDAPVTRLANDADLWIRTLREKLADPVALQDEGDRLRQWVLKHFILEDGLDEWEQVLTQF